MRKLVTKECFNYKVQFVMTGEFVSAFHFLCTKAKGLDLLIREFDYFKPLISESVFKDVFLGISFVNFFPLYYFVSSPEGQSLLVKEFDFFREIITISYLKNEVKLNGDESPFTLFDKLRQTSTGNTFLDLIKLNEMNSQGKFLTSWDNHKTTDNESNYKNRANEDTWVSRLTTFFKR